MRPVFSNIYFFKSQIYLFSTYHTNSPKNRVSSDFLNVLYVIPIVWLCRVPDLRLNDNDLNFTLCKYHLKIKKNHSLQCIILISFVYLCQFTVNFLCHVADDDRIS